MRLSLSLLSVLTVAACNPADPNGSESTTADTAVPAAVAIPADFTVASDAELRGAALSGSLVSYQLAYILTYGAEMDALTDGSCPAISVDGDTVTLTGGCTSAAGVAYTGSVSLENIDIGFSFDVNGSDVDFDIPIPEYDPGADSAWTFSHFGMTPPEGGGARLFDGEMVSSPGAGMSIALDYGRSPDVATSTLLVDCRDSACADASFAGAVSGLGTFDIEFSDDGASIDLIGANTLTLRAGDDGCIQIGDAGTHCVEDEMFTFTEPVVGGVDNGALGAMGMTGGSGGLGVTLTTDDTVASVMIEIEDVGKPHADHELHDLMDAVPDEAAAVAWSVTLVQNGEYDRGDSTAFAADSFGDLAVLYRAYDEDGELVGCSVLADFAGESDFDLAGCPE